MIFEAWRYNMNKQRYNYIATGLSGHFFKSEEWDLIDISSEIIVNHYSTGSFDRVCFFLN